MIWAMNRISGVKAVSFDADGALRDFDKVMRHSLGHALRELESVDAEAASVLDIEKMIAVRQATFEEMKGRATNLERRFDWRRSGAPSGMRVGRMTRWHPVSTTYTSSTDTRTSRFSTTFVPR